MASQSMKPATAAKKLGIYLPAAPEEFRTSTVTREQLEEWAEKPPEWLAQLRQHGPHPRGVVAQRLGVSTSGLARAGVSDALTTEEINEIRDTEPAWLVREREVQRGVREEAQRVADRDLGRRILAQERDERP